MFITPAYAQAAGGSAADMIPSLAMMALIFVVFYFLLIRPQQRKAKQHKEMLAGLKRGDRVVTAGGIIGMVATVPGDGPEVEIEISEKVRVKVLRGTITDILSKTEPRDDDAKKDDAKKDDAKK